MLAEVCKLLNASFVLEDLNVSNLNSHEGPPDWLCQVCNGLIPQCLMTCIFCGFRRQSHEGRTSSLRTNCNYYEPNKYS